MVEYGLRLGSGRGVARDLEAQARWMERAAKAGHRTAQANLGLFYTLGEGVPRDAAKAREWLEKSARGGSSRGMYNLSRLLFSPPDGAADEALGREWLQKAARAGFPPAVADLAAFHLGGRHGFAQDPEAALRLAREAASRFQPRAEAVLGDIHRRGLAGVAPSDRDAALWYERSARHGSLYGQQRFASLKLEGRGRPRDPGEALFWALVGEANAPDEASKGLFAPLLARASAEVAPAQQEDVRQRAAAWRPQQ